MLNGKTVAVVVPAYNEESQIENVILSMPEFVDRIVVVNDNSSDRTAEVVEGCIEKDQTPTIECNPFATPIPQNPYNRAELVVRENHRKEMDLFPPSQIVNRDASSDRIILINNLVNGGVGTAIARGYKWCKDHEIDCTSVMAGDGQMDPAELESICLPVVTGNVNYVKGNRLVHPSAWHMIPKTRFIGNSILSILTKIASGYWRVSDTQTGFTAISRRALNKIAIHKIYSKYGMPNDLLVKLNIAQCSITEVEIKPIYQVGEQSKMKPWRVIPKISWLLVCSFFKRLYLKYLVRDFHPLFLFYHLSLFLWLLALPYFFKIIKAFIYIQTVNYEPLFAFLFLTISSFQALIFAMWMDIQDNDRLFK